MSNLTKLQPANMEILRRTFEAAKHPKGSAERERLNRDAVTSEYMTSYRYVVRWEARMSDGRLNPAQKYHHKDFRTKAEAERFVNSGHGGSQ